MSRYRCSVLVVDDEPPILNMLLALLATDFDVLTAPSAEKALELFAQREFDIVVSDQQLPGQSGVRLLEWVRQHSPRTIRILMTGMARLEDAVDAINCGQVHRYLFKPWRPEQLLQTLRNAARTFLLERSHEQLLEELRRLNLELEQRVQDRTRELEAANRQLQQRNQMLQKMALTDELTGLPNRRAMDRLARNELLRRARTPSPLALGIIDADHFKDVNSRYMHTGGDQALAWLAQTLANSLRTIDAVGRIGGEEFMLVAPDTGFDGARALAERVRKTVEVGHTEFGGEVIRLTVSIGVVVAERDVLVGFDQMRHAAAAALNEAKASGRNCCVVKRMSAFEGPSAV